MQSKSMAFLYGKQIANKLFSNKELINYCRQLMIQVGLKSQYLKHSA